MARQPTFGTPTRSKHYLRPRSKWAYVLPALALGIGALGLLLLLHLVGWRKPVSPGSVIDKHASFESRCDECHKTARGVQNVRCQRCHDPAGAGRLANGAHVLFGSGDQGKAAKAPDLTCASCHVEHRGRKARLAQVNPVQCAQCHFRRFGGHPEFALFRKKTVEVPGLKFPHDKHIEDLMKKGGVPTVLATCRTCHGASGRDFAPLSFDTHCASCHGKEGRLETPVDPIPEQDVLSLTQAAAQGVTANLGRPEEFEAARGKIAKTAVHHRDPWVLLNLGRLRLSLDPQGLATERGALLARLSQLRRREALAIPLASLDAQALEARARALDVELKGVGTRLAGLAGAKDAGASLSRLDEILAAIGASGDAEAQTEAKGLKDKAVPLSSAPSEALGRSEVDARRAELLSLLDAIEAADAGLKPRVADLRRRLLALSPGESSADVLARVRDRRLAELGRVRDELELRRAGVRPSSESLLQNEGDAIRRAIADVQARIAALDRAGEAGPAPAEEELARKKETLTVLAAPCAKCHIVASGRLEPVVAARRVLTRSTFVHEPHVLAVKGDCMRCHPSLPKSKLSQDLNLRGIASCRECHSTFGVRQECLTCHRYHPPAVP